MYGLLNRSINAYRTRKVITVLRLTDSALAQINANLNKVQLKFLLGPGLNASGLDLITNGNYQNDGDKSIFNHTLNGQLVDSFSNSSIDVKIEEYDKFYITKIWVKDPSKQVCKAEAGWEKQTRVVPDILNGTNGAIVGVNGSGFYDKKGGFPPPKGIADHTTEGDFVITNGAIRRKLSDKVNNTLIGITKSGLIKYYENSSVSDIERDGIYNIFTFGPLLIKDGADYTQTSGKIRQKYTGKEAKRMLVGQVDNNNYVFICTKGSNKSNLNDIKSIGKQLHCRILFNLDGGGSTSLWFRKGTTGQGTKITGGSRPVADSLYFSSLE